MGKVEAVILAAGLSSRMGSHKLLLPVKNKTIIENVLDIIFSGGLSNISVVVGHGKEEILEVLRPYRIKIIHNPLYRQGMSTSLKSAVEHLSKDKQTEAILVFNGDMPLIKPDTVTKMLKQYEDTRPLLSAPVYQGRRGHPVLFARELFEQLLAITGDMGARQVVEQNVSLMQTVAVDDPGIHLDIDSREDYQSAVALAAR